MSSCPIRPLTELALLALVDTCGRTTTLHTPGEIPRDTNGRPVLSPIKPSMPRAGP